MRKILVTGGAGYIGSHTVVELNNAGYIPIIVDNLCNTTKKNLKGINSITKKEIIWYNVNCINKQELEEVFKKEKNIQGVIHFAAYKSVEDSVNNPEKYYKNNIGSLEVLLEVMKKFHIRNIIFSSSCTVYGNPEVLPVTESSPFKKAESPYGETKQICEGILKNDSSQSVSLRYFNPIGSHNSSKIGDCSLDKPTNLVPIITEVAIRKRKAITIFGNDYKTVDGTCVRDYIHVVDLAKAHVKAMDFIYKNPGKHAFNVGTGKGVSVLEAIEIFEKANQLKINYKIGPRRPGDVVEIYANSSKIKKELNWFSEKSLSEAMIDAWNWEKNKDHKG